MSLLSSFKSEILKFYINNSLWKLSLYRGNFFVLIFVLVTQYGFYCVFAKNAKKVDNACKSDYNYIPIFVTTHKDYSQ